MVDRQKKNKKEKTEEFQFSFILTFCLQNSLVHGGGSVVDTMQGSTMMITTDHQEARVPVLRMKRCRGWTPDAVHVQVRKRRRLADALKSLSVSGEKKDYSATPQETTEGENAKYIVFRRVNLSNDAAERALESASAVHMVDLDTAHLMRTDNENNGKSETAINENSNKEGFHIFDQMEGKYSGDGNEADGEMMTDEDQRDILFVPEDGTARERVPQAWRDGMTEEVNDVAVVQPGHIEQLDELLSDFVYEGKLNGTSDTSDEFNHDDSDYDAQTVDYPSTPEGDDPGFSNDGYGFGEEDEDVNDEGNERRQRYHWMDNNDNYSSDGDDYERYEHFAENVEYDSEC